MSAAVEPIPYGDLVLLGDSRSVVVNIDHDLVVGAESPHLDAPATVSAGIRDVVDEHLAEACEVALDGQAVFDVHHDIGIERPLITARHRNGRAHEIADVEVRPMQSASASSLTRKYANT